MSVNQSPCFSKLLYSIIILSLIYWIYLASTVQPILVHDALSYQHLGSILYNKGGWIEYFKTGPNREPVYPFLLSISMRLADVLSVSYLSVQIFFQFGVLWISQLLLLKILNKLKMRPLGLQ